MRRIDQQPALSSSRFASGPCRMRLSSLDARVRITAAVAWSLTFAILSGVAPLAMGVVGAALLSAAARDRVRLLRGVLLVNVFVAFLWLFVPWTTPGKPVASLGPLIVSDAGLQLGLVLTLRANAIAAASLALFDALSPLDFARALRALGLPTRLTLVFFFCARYLGLLADEYQRMRDALRLRGFTPRTNPATYHSLARLLGLLIIRGYDRAEHVRDALRLRGYTGEIKLLPLPRLTRRDLLFASALLLYLFGVILLQWMTAKH